MTLHASLALLFVEATIRWVRIPRLAGWLGVAVADGRHPTDAASVRQARAQRSDVERVALHATLRVVRRWPFGTGPCLRESLVLGHLLRSGGPVLCFGVARRRGRVMAHAWVEIDGRPINDPQGVIPLRGTATQR